MAKHNLAFETSSHATKLFHRMFSDSAIAKKFACGSSKTSAIIKETLAPHYVSKALHDKFKFFSIKMDESNNKRTNCVSVWFVALI